jgi:hypothetical protein
MIVETFFIGKGSPQKEKAENAMGVGYTMGLPQPPKTGEGVLYLE